MVRRTLTLLLCTIVICSLALPVFGQNAKDPRVRLKTYHPAPRGIAPETLRRFIDAEANSAAAPPVSPLPLAHWGFNVTSSRDGQLYGGVMVGNRALVGGTGTANIPTQIIPVKVNTVALATDVDFSTGLITVETGNPGDNTTFDPTAADDTCLAHPNDVPIRVLRQSPLFNPADFNFGGVDVGVTQFFDAYQRSSFWNTIDRSSYHVMLNPVKVLDELTLDVPAPAGGSGGLAIDLPNLFPGFGLCGHFGIVDIFTIDNFVNSQFAALAAKGVHPSSFPVFAFYNVSFSLVDPINIFNCCAAGYHSASDVGSNGTLLIQTYSAFDFDRTNFFINDDGSGVSDTDIGSHEVAEWGADPVGGNPTPAWGHTGQVSGCQGNLEVGDPLTGLLSSKIRMPNGFTYQLQELADFSWFFGSVNGGPPTIGVNRWYSDNATFLTNAGPPCTP